MNASDLGLANREATASPGISGRFSPLISSIQVSGCSPFLAFRCSMSLPTLVILDTGANVCGESSPK
jgi:hypothetical protein